MNMKQLSKKEWVEWAIKNGIGLTKEEVEAEVQKYNDIVSQSVPFNGRARLKPNNIDRMTKWRTDTIYFPRDLNVHDPEDQLVWAEPALPAWVWVARAAGSVAFIVGIYCLVLLGLSF
jgi:hypothetical protein